MDKLVKRLGAWIGRAGQGGSRSASRSEIILFEDLWPLCFVPETERRERRLLSADLPSPEAEAH